MNNCRRCQVSDREDITGIKRTQTLTQKIRCHLHKTSLKVELLLLESNIPFEREEHPLYNQSINQFSFIHRTNDIATVFLQV